MDGRTRPPPMATAGRSRRMRRCRNRSCKISIRRCGLRSRSAGWWRRFRGCIRCCRSAICSRGSANVGCTGRPSRSISRCRRRCSARSTAAPTKRASTNSSARASSASVTRRNATCRSSSASTTRRCGAWTRTGCIFLATTISRGSPTNSATGCTCLWPWWKRPWPPPRWSSFAMASSSITSVDRGTVSSACRR